MPTSADGAIITPAGWGADWYAWQATGGAERRDLIAFGDSTWYGAGPDPSYSVMQRLRDRAVESGLPDGGKGIVGAYGTEYDPPEVNAFVGSTFTGNATIHDNLVGAYWYDDATGGAGHTLDLQFRATGTRIWYGRGGGSFGAGFTYSLDGGAPVAVDNSGSGLTFAYISGLTLAVHTLRIVNTGGGNMRVAIAPVNATGLVINKHATSGATFGQFFHNASPSPAVGPWDTPMDGNRYQTAMGLAGATVQGPDYAGMTVDTTTPVGGRVVPILAMTQLGFNDLSYASGDVDLPAWTAYVRKFAAACRAASCDGIVCSGQMAYKDVWLTAGIPRYEILRDEAAAQGLAFVDTFFPVGGLSLDYAGSASNPHLQKAEYVAQADYLWDNLLKLGAGPISPTAGTGAALLMVA